MWNEGRPYGLDAVWFIPGRRYIVVGDGLFETYSTGSQWVRNTTLAPLHKTCIDGTVFNDIVVGGAFWDLVHYNGASWRSYFPFTSGSFGEVAVKGNLVFAVGDVGNRAVVVQGRR